MGIAILDFILSLHLLVHFDKGRRGPVRRARGLAGFGQINYSLGSTHLPVLVLLTTFWPS